MEQETLSKIIAENLTLYRKNANLTQLEVAEKLNYSDKSVSKWEQANGVPDVFVLQQLAEMYGVTVNDFLCRHEEVPAPPKRKDNINRWIIMSLSAGLCWLVAVVVYVFLGLFRVSSAYTWLSFIFAIPAMFIVLVVFACVWKFYILRILSSSAIVWTGLLAIYLVLRLVLQEEAYLIFFIGIPMQVLIIFWFGLRHRVRKKKEKKN
jgi:transcriptional regulator with XRE-family HTH domain